MASTSTPLLQSIAPKHDKLKADTIGLKQAMAMSVAGIGATSSILFVTGLIAKSAGASTPFVVVLASLACLSVGFTIREFSKFVSSSASFYGFLTIGLGKEFGFIGFWIMLIGYGCATIANSLIFSGWVSDVIFANSGYQLHWGFWVIFLNVVLGILAYMGINMALTVTLVLFSYELVVISILSLFIIVKGGAEGNYPYAFLPVGEYSGGTQGIMAGLVYSITVFLGFEQAAILGEETKNPAKNIGIAVTLSILFTLLYMTLGIYAMIVGVGPSHCFSLYLSQAPADYFARKYVSNYYGIFVDIAGIFTTFNCQSSAINTMYRLLYSFGRERILGLGVLGYTSSSKKTPMMAILCWTIVVISVTLVVGISAEEKLWSLSTKGAWTAFGNITFLNTMAIIIVFILTSIALPVYVFRNHRSKLSVVSHILLPVVSITSMTVALIPNFYPLPSAPLSYFVIFLIVWVLLGIVIVLILRKKSPETLERIGSAINSPPADHTPLASSMSQLLEQEATTVQ